jgi:hypothetical protein
MRSLLSLMGQGIILSNLRHQEIKVDLLDLRISMAGPLYSCLNLHRGATCYLNSLLQAMFMTPELREGLFNIDPNDLGVQLVNLPLL